MTSIAVGIHESAPVLWDLSKDPHALVVGSSSSPVEPLLDSIAAQARMHGTSVLLATPHASGARSVDSLWREYEGRHGLLKSADPPELGQLEPVLLIVTSLDGLLDAVPEGSWRPKLLEVLSGGHGVNLHVLIAADLVTNLMRLDRRADQFPCRIGFGALGERSEELLWGDAASALADANALHIRLGTTDYPHCEIA